ncbi:11644_t:CDS:2 [Funneliformis caledonium]|uniref:11644_t:CDS:1 n=1 Tax=Funneliformis caledonium TaxID=1117310 RepID=A0A9N9B6I4_9GLOM|nr:11644_t:CDS:2 [Funneliformis caledonium]
MHIHTSQIYQFEKKKNINNENCLPETQLLTRQKESESSEICQKRLAKERQANLRKK